ncbi:MAG: AsmA family protein [Deltaproteobacteria bacterium]|nr:AsmA family protein [Deltaproteobacteria bacterium]
MKRTLRTALIGAAALILLIAVGIGLAVTFVNPNDYKGRIETAVYNATGKQLVLQGDLSLSVFPRLGLKAGPAEILDDASFGSEPLARVEELSVLVDLVPLLRGKAEIRAATVSGLRLKLAVNEKGDVNWVAPRPAQVGPGGVTVPDQGGSAVPARRSASPDLTAFALDSLSMKDILVDYTDMRTKETMLIAVPSFTLDSLRVGQKTDLAVEASYTGPLARPVRLALNARFVLPSTLAEGVTFAAKGNLDETPFSFSGTAAVPDTAEGQRFSLKGELEAGAVNLDTYLAVASPPKPRPSGGGGGKNNGAAAKTGAGVAEFLRTVFLDVRMSMQSLTVAKVPLRDIAASVKADKGLLVAKPVTMSIAGGPLTLEASVDARDGDIRGRSTGDWRNAKLGDLLRAATGKASLTGGLTASWSVNWTGAALDAATRTLEGKASARLNDGVLPGFRLIPAGVPGLPAKTMDLKNIQASGNWNIAQGIARNNDLAVQAAGLSAAGSGRLDIPAQTMQYTLSVELPTLPEVPNLTVLPVVVSGPFASPSYSIDQPALLRDTAKSILNPSTKAGKEIQRGLGKLLGR